ncbi:DUF3187 family protein [Desulfoluna sp.]|uniref:DUF3187 family protein n=1 Tax=Desulfoluna sp. TaxID=2045199 RepID=UPI00262B85D0|nr:DUF3187 family protein [Desulfoluna sp.]
MRCRSIVAFVFSALLFFLSLYPGVATAGLGPFRLPALGSGEFIRMVPSFASPFSDSVPGRVEVGMDVRWLNTWVHHVESDAGTNWEQIKDPSELKYGSFIYDVETVAFTPSVLYRASDRLALGFQIPVAIQGGGILDGFIEGFHSMVGVGQHSRDEFPRDSSHYLVVDRNDVAHDKSDQIKRFITGDVQLSASVLVSQWPQLTARAIIKLPTSRIYDDQESSGTDGTLQLLWSWQWGPVAGYHGVGGTVYTRDGDDNLDLERYRFTTLNSFEYMSSETFSWILGVNTASRVADYPELDEPIVEMTLGFKKVVGPGVLEFGIIENLFFFDNSPDAGLQLGYTLKL